MKSFISDGYEALAFDLDGTLYDEYDFIKQAYLPVSETMASKQDREKMYEMLCRLWLIHGSSANIFQMAYENLYDRSMDKRLLSDCIDSFRKTDINLKLSDRTSGILDLCKDVPKVIITDGNSQLQRKKIKALGLDRWFREEDIFVSGDYGKDAYKPNPYMGDLVKKRLKTDKILYFGDRKIDEEFAENAGFAFRMVKNMIIV